MDREDLSAAELREIGKQLFLQSRSEPEKRSEGIEYLLSAHRKRDPEATYYVARMLLDGVLHCHGERPEDFALRLLCNVANRGCLPARRYLNRYCVSRYNRRFPLSNETGGPLTDFNGKVIKIKRTGLFTPVDVTLEYRGGENVLTFRLNLRFMNDDFPDQDWFREAVRSGFRDWAGEYRVFGGQKVVVRVEITEEDRFFDNVTVFAITDELSGLLRSVSVKLPGKGSSNLVSTLDQKRSFAHSGMKKWSVRSRKVICMFPPNGDFSDVAEIRAIAKHEFGHVLGLGDLYESASDSLEGVEEGKFAELDSFSLGKRFYNLVMCDHHGPISNNDVEMVILAFRDNKGQDFQVGRYKRQKNISEALGKGN